MAMISAWWTSRSILATAAVSPVEAFSPSADGLVVGDDAVEGDPRSFHPT